MPQLPDRPNLEHLKKQAKDLLRKLHEGDTHAYERFRASLPAARSKDEAAVAALKIRLHDAQSCIACEYGFASWDELRTYVEWGRTDDPSHLIHRWLVLAYGHGHERPRPAVAARMLEEKPDLASNLLIACATGDDALLRQALTRNDNWVNATPVVNCPDCGEPLGRPPLVAVTHSGLAQLDGFRDRLRRSVRLLLDAGADPNQSWNSGDCSLTALYGAAGKNHDPEMTRMLLAAGASPNDGESLYHSIESRDLTCAKLLLDAGATVEETNALHHQLDTDNLEGLCLLLAHTRDANDPSSSLGSPLLWAIRRRRSRAHIEALLQAGADPLTKTREGVSAYRLAVLFGLDDVTDALANKVVPESFTIEEQFISACSRGDESTARQLLTTKPDILTALSETQLRLLPNQAEAGNSEAVRLMVELGWPVAVRGGDWDATALNLAVIRGDSKLTRFLLEHGARWTERHGYDDNVIGTLAWASRNHNPAEGDWVGCAKALVDHGLPVLELDEHDYSDEVAAFLDTERAKLKASGRG